MTARILDPLHLTGASVPEGASAMPTPYLHGYLTSDQGVTVDVSAAGGDPSSMISTTGDLDRFITVLFQGRLLPPALLAQMFALPRDAQGNLLPYTGDDGNCETGAQKGLACFGLSLGIGSDTLPDGACGGARPARTWVTTAPCSHPRPDADRRRVRRPHRRGGRSRCGDRRPPGG